MEIKVKHRFYSSHTKTANLDFYADYLCLKMKKNKIISYSVCVTILISVFSGCGGKSVSSASDDMTVPANSHEMTDLNVDDIEEYPFQITFVSGTETGYVIEETSGGTVVNFEGKITEDTTYSISGTLNGSIIIDADRNNSKEFRLNLDGAVIRSENSPPVTCLSGGKFVISAKEGNESYIIDGRGKITDDSDVSSCVYSKPDLQLSGGGKLYVKSEYNNGVHSKGNLSVDDVELYVYCSDNALKGNDKVDISSGVITLFSSEGDGIKTSNTDISGKNGQNGSVLISAASSRTELNIYAGRDGIDAAYDTLFEDNGYDLSVNIYTDRYADTTGLPDIASPAAAIPSASGNTLSLGWGGFGGWGMSDGNTDKGEYSTKGIKAAEQIRIRGGNITIRSYDDSIHAGAGKELENGSRSSGNITVSGGSLTLYSNDDAIHADDTLSVSGGKITVESCYEGMEANHILISGGDIKIYSKDDGLNVASSVSESPDIIVSGGKVDITMGKGDVDGIDSNGSYTQIGGIVISRGAPGSANQMATGLDVERKAEISGGTIVLLGGLESVPGKGEGIYQLNYGTTGRGGGFGRRGGGSASVEKVTLTAGTWTVDGTDISFEVESKYSGCTILSDILSAGETYTLTNGSESFKADAS